MNLLHHLVTFGIVNTGSYALQEALKDTSLYQHFLTVRVPEHDSQAVTNVDNMQCFQPSIKRHTTNELKRIPDDPNHLSASSNSDLLHDSQAHPITSNSAQDSWLDSLLYYHALITASNELPSSNHDVTRSDTLSSQVIQQPSNMVSNITPHSYSDPYQQQFTSPAGPRTLYDANPRFSSNSLETIEPWTSNSNSISEANASLIPNVLPGLQNRETISNWQNPSSSLSDWQTPASNHQTLPVEQNWGTTLTESGLLSSHIIPCSESEIKYRLDEFHSSKHSIEGQYSRGSDTKTKRKSRRDELVSIFGNAVQFCYYHQKILFDYIDREYDMKIEEDYANVTYGRALESFPAYLMFVEVINLLLPVDDMAQAMKSACDSFIKVDRCFSTRKTEEGNNEFSTYMQSKLVKPSSLNPLTFFWCFVEVWLKESRSSFFGQVKMKNTPGQVSTQFKTYTQHLFIQHVKVFTETVIEPSLRSLGPIPQGPDSESLSNLSGRLPLKFNKEAFVLKHPDDPYMQALADALIKVAEFPSAIIVEELALGRLVNSFFQAKGTQFGNKQVKQAELFSRSFKIAYKHFMQNANTWLNYFNQKYNLGLQHYDKRLPCKRSRELFPLYLYYADMINQIIIRRDPNTGGVLSASNSFFTLMKFYDDPKSEQVDRNLWRSLYKTMKDRSRNHTLRSVWVYLNYWIEDQGKCLLSRASINSGARSFNAKYKGFFDFIFILSCENRTKKLIEFEQEQKS